MCVRVPKEPASLFFQRRCAESWRRWEFRAWFYGVVLKNDRFLVLENDRILVLENDRFLVLENDRHPMATGRSSDRRKYDGKLQQTNIG